MPSEILLTTANEAAKKGSSFLDALFRPKIDRVSAWARRHEFVSQLSDAGFRRALSEYFSETTRRISTVANLAFPNVPIALPRIYQSLTIVRGSSHLWSFNVDFFRERNPTLIIDDAGAGKTTLLKYYCLQALQLPEWIPLFVELRMLDNKHTLKHALFRPLAALSLEYSDDLLRLLLREKQFVIFLDGLDEVQEDIREGVILDTLDLITSAPGNLVIATSRPTAAASALYYYHAARIQPFSRSNAEELLDRFDSISDSRIGERLKQHLDAAPADFIQNPLLLSLLYKTYGYNGAIAPNASAFYDEMYQALYKTHDLTKAGFVRQKKSGLDYIEFRRLLQALCFRCSLSARYAFRTEDELVREIEEAGALIGLRNFRSGGFSEDLREAVPLLMREGTELVFAHRSVVDYFTAEYVVARVDKRDFFKKILTQRLGARFGGAVGFLSTLDPVLYREALLHPLALAFVEHYRRVPLVTERSLYASLTFAGNEVAFGFFQTDGAKRQDENRVGELEQSEHAALISELAGRTAATSSELGASGRLHYRAESDDRQQASLEISWSVQPFFGWFVSPLTQLQDARDFSRNPRPLPLEECPLNRWHQLSATDTLAIAEHWENTAFRDAFRCAADNARDTFILFDIQKCLDVIETVELELKTRSEIEGLLALRGPES